MISRHNLPTLHGSLLTLHGFYAQPIAEAVYAVSYPGQLSGAHVAAIQRTWRNAMGDRAKLIVLDGGATITPFAPPMTTPIFDSLCAELGQPF